MAHTTADDPDALIEWMVEETMRVAGHAPAPTGPKNPDTRLTRRDTAAALRAAGFPFAEKTLATQATRGGNAADLDDLQFALTLYHCAHALAAGDGDA